ncbi:hypothetical protein P691DRAFT_806909 [Macrolepiota fuliginosa MF-IS2]|uniref:Uncharacterized protein n=1 Tax=Macrolepiota fuliginosa MF-IS2 TaxID=1400762 RepID=A0A9P6C855_9AGAR|nr:hypothetical protein P691DRAFT_806909 [Macrolepiota fuliginosa MF-IS2]
MYSSSCSSAGNFVAPYNLLGSSENRDRLRILTNSTSRLGSIFISQGLVHAGILFAGPVVW